MKCYFKFTKHALMAAAVLIAATSCSDDEKDYLDDVYYTANQEAVVVVGSGASSTPAEGLPSFNICFDAAANWQIKAKDLANPSQTADWVSFYTSAGEEGSQRLGLYVSANTSADERAALIEISSNGKTAAFTLVQMASGIVANPNATSIDPNKTISRIEYYEAGATEPAKTIEFTYTATGVLSAETITTGTGDNQTKKAYTIATESRQTQAGIGINKVTIQPDDDVNAGESFAIVNGQVAIGYNSLVVKNNTANNQIGFSYNQGYLNNISSQNVEKNYSFSWTSDNLTTVAPASISPVNATYSAELNDCNLDLNWFVGLNNISYGINADNNALGAMNLLGKRSANLVSSANGNRGDETFTYTSGVTSANGDASNGITVTTSQNRTIKVFFAE